MKTQWKPDPHALGLLIEMALVSHDDLSHPSEASLPLHVHACGLAAQARDVIDSAPPDDRDAMVTVLVQVCTVLATATCPGRGVPDEERRIWLARTLRLVGHASLHLAINQ